MNVRKPLTAAFIGIAFLFTTQVSAEVKVTVSKTHLCCGQCVKVVDKTLGEVKGVKHEANQDNSTITVTAESVQVAQQAIDALAAAGFHGKLDNAEVKYKPIDVPKGKVAKLEISGIHNCCGQCTKAIKATLKAVEGVKSDTAKPKMDSFVIEGDFSASSAVDALLAAGFHIQLKK